MIRTPLQAPKANAHAERWVGSVRRECLDRSIILGRRHIERVLEEYVDHYNNARPHRAFQLHPPNRRLSRVRPEGAIRCRARLGGLLREYSRVAELGCCMNTCTPQPTGGHRLGHGCSRISLRFEFGAMGKVRRASTKGTLNSADTSG